MVNQSWPCRILDWGVTAIGYIPLFLLLEMGRVVVFVINLVLIFVPFGSMIAGVIGIAYELFSLTMTSLFFIVFVFIL
jgi:hypothetical protein